ncbi:hypothetical protein D3C86_2078020 [compost metagenome]
MQIIGQLVCFNPDERVPNTVDCTVEVLHFNIGELFREMLLQITVVTLPEGAAAADHIFPKSRL